MLKILSYGEKTTDILRKKAKGGGGGGEERRNASSISPALKVPKLDQI